MTDPDSPRIREQRPSFLTKRRLAKGWSKMELAARAGMSKTQVHHLETQQRRWNEDMKARLSAALGCAPDDLFVDPDLPVENSDQVLSIWDRVPAELRPKAIEILETLAKK